MCLQKTDFDWEFSIYPERSMIMTSHGLFGFM